MRLVLYVLAAWTVVSVPAALFFGLLCGTNQLSLDDEGTHVAPAGPHNRERRHPAALEAVRPHANMTPA